MKVERVQASAEEKKYFAGEDAHVFEIEGLDEKGQDVDLSYASIVKIPIEKDKKVKKVFFLPEGKEAVELAFEQTDSHVIFTAPHFTHYAFVYESAEKPQPAKPAPQNTVLPKPTYQPASDQQKAPKLEVQEEKVAFHRQEHENAEMLVGEQRVIIQGRDGLLRHVFEVDENGQRRLRSTEVIQEAIPEIVEIGTKVKTVPAVVATQEKPAQNTAVKSEEASKQLPNTGTADANEALIAGLASLGLASLALTLRRKREDKD
ncbi:endo-beta-N-acetylglucosaminidase [Streptococcus pneumoniae]|nr:endo-beta-N-acetylglucosaminidase [Streptococcus pneumoniae]